MSKARKTKPKTKTTKKVVSEHDKSYRRLFSHARMIEDLLRGFVKEKWVEDLDFSTLEKVNASYVTEDFRSRADDVIWKVRRHNGESLFIYLLLEFQSTVDPFMAVRMMVYLGLLYQDLIDSKQLTADRKLPPVLPVVLYNGKKSRWYGAQEINELIADGPQELEKYRPHLSYLLLDEGSYKDSQLTPLVKNMVAAIFRLENSRTETDFLQVIEALSEWLKDPAQERIKVEIERWLNHLVLPKRLPGVKLTELISLQEMRTMLSESVDDWAAQWKAQGLQQGLEQGLAQGLNKGRVEGQAQLLIGLLEEKFGPLDPDIHATIYRLDDESLIQCAKRTLKAQSLREVIGH
ncbi:hypothetical protein PN36_25765 [Candidatus Thiomargarita nelsonii]|uniref:Transposase (putative) YhgA-like domain-containing protein n=1 Tax=Candidatus Thiomargarita nelsonii TaxID=1003181 RepID=A0A4E0QMG3_9GAMM|nr:hypothetical protein PN36_25765 [Candidatus Thiomargarita nelsonii]